MQTLFFCILFTSDYSLITNFSYLLSFPLYYQILPFLHVFTYHYSFSSPFLYITNLFPQPYAFSLTTLSLKF